MKIIILGTGTSVGIPSLGPLGWGRCDPKNPKNKRQRCSILIKDQNTNILIDAGPDIKNQLIDHNIKSLDAVLITHEHSDHVAGLDELRAFYFQNKQKLNLFTHIHTGNYLMKKFDYLFNKKYNSPSYFEPPLNFKEIHYYKDFKINNINIKPIKQNHGVMDTLGFIFNDKFAYCTDVVNFPEKSFNELYGLDILILEGLRTKPHIAHAHFELSFKWIDKLKPKYTYLTHFSPESDHLEVTNICPNNVEPAYDGLILDI